MHNVKNNKGDNMHQSIKKIISDYGNSSDIVTRTINNISYIYLESVCSDDKISNFLNKSITKINSIKILSSELANKIFNSNIKIEKDLSKIYYFLSSGFTCIFIKNEKKYIVIETKTKLDRGITESNTESNIRGPKDSFTENHSINIGLIRKRIKEKDLWLKELIVGKRTFTKINLIYIKGLANQKVLEDVKEKISKINIDSILDSSYIRNYLEKKSLFPTIISTERPDLVCHHILNGKIIILVENSPVALILPTTLDEYLKSSEDYYQKASCASFSRIIRYIAFIITLLTPALYIALMTFNQEVIPDQLLISLATQRSKVPFPTFIETILFIIIFEILREADIRAPSASGASMSIVGALVLGDAAVAADIVSPIAIIVVAITSICELIFSDQDLSNAIRIWRLLFIISTIFLGIIGILCIGIILIIKLAEINFYNVPYLIPLAPFNKNIINDSILVKNEKNRNERPNYITKNTTRVINK